MDVETKNSTEVQDDLDPALYYESSSNSFPVQNSSLTNIITQFIKKGEVKLSSFLRKKILFKIEGVTSCRLEEIKHDYTKQVMLNFHIAPQDKYGLITFDFSMLHGVINLLYGGRVNASEPTMQQPGKLGLVIAEKISELLLSVFQETMVAHLKVNMNISKISAQLTPAFKQDKFGQCYHLSFLVFFDSLPCQMSITLSESMFLSDPTDSEQKLLNQADSGQSLICYSSVLDEKTKRELIDSDVTVSVNLANISLKLREVVNLKAGDVIPIDDPTQVYVFLNEKVIFKASAGQSNLRRAIKIIDKI